MSPPVDAYARTHPRPAPTGPTVLVHQHCWNRGDGPGPTGEWRDSKSLTVGVGEHDIAPGRARGTGGWDGTDLSSIHWDPTAVDVSVTSNQGHTLKLTRPGYCLQDTDETRHYDNNVRRISVVQRGTGDAGYDAPVVTDVVGNVPSGGAPPAVGAPPPDLTSTPPASAGSSSAPGGGGGSSLMIVGAVGALLCLCSCVGAVAIAASSSSGGGGGGDGGSSEYDESY